MENQYNAGNGNPSNGSATVSLVLGILSLVFIFLFAPVGLVLGIIGIIMANKAKAIDPQNGSAKAGFVTSLIGLIICAIITVIMILAVVLLGAALSLGISALGDIGNITVY